MAKQIHWFPGHMVKARRQIKERMKLVDIVFEIVDARIPYSSQNPDIKELVGNKKRLVLLNKSDIADPNVTKAWIGKLTSDESEAIAIDATSRSATDKIVGKAKEMLAEKFAKEQAKGLRPRPIRAMIIGIPNSGKSTLLNTLAKRKAARVANRPGVTTAQQWVKVGDTLELLDTPGILWPKFESEHIGYNLALTGAIRDAILPMDDVAIYGLNYLKKNYPGLLKSRYKLNDADLAEEEIVHLLTRIGENRNFIIRGGEVDYDRVCEMLIKELRDVVVGRINFETPEEIEAILLAEKESSK